MKLGIPHVHDHTLTGGSSVYCIPLVAEVHAVSEIWLLLILEFFSSLMFNHFWRCNAELSLTATSFAYA